MHGRSDPEEVLDELDDHVLVGAVIAQLDCDLQHVLAEQRHPGGAVRLLQVAAGRQRALRSKTPMLSRPRKPPSKTFLPSVLAIHPPGEIQQQFLEGS